MKIYNRFDEIKKVLSNSEYSVEDYKYVLNKLNDEKSKLSLYYRVMLDNTEDSYYGLNLVKSSYYGESFNCREDKVMFNCINFLLKDNNYKKNIYFIGISKINSIPNIVVWHSDNPANVECIFDRVSHEQEYIYNCSGKQINVISLDRLSTYSFKEDSIFIISDVNYMEYYSYLLDELNINPEKIFYFDVSVDFQRNFQYFGESFLNISYDEIFVDAGAYDLKTMYGFLYWVNNMYRGAYSFEPVKELYDNCISTLNNYNIPNFEIYNLGLWDKKEIVSFSVNDSASRINDAGESSINVDSLDNVLNGREVTIIKMDIEGAEYNAIVGASSTIKRYKPTLMISAYHEPNDILKLVKLVMSINPDYKLYIRHYAYTCYETVLYFVPKEKVNEI